MPRRARTINVVAPNLVAALAKLGMSQTELALQLGVTLGAVHNYFQPWRVITRPTLQRLSNALNELAVIADNPARWTVSDLVAVRSPYEPDDLARKPFGVPVFVTAPRRRAPIPPPTAFIDFPPHYGGPGSDASNTMIVLASTSSMLRFGIRCGTELVIRSDLIPQDGDIVIGWIGDNTAFGLYGYHEGEPTLFYGPASNQIMVDVTHNADLFVVVAWSNVGRLSDQA